MIFTLQNMQRTLYISIFTIVCLLLSSASLAKGGKKKIDESTVVKEKKVLDSIPNKDASKTIDDTLVYDDYEVPSANDQDSQYVMLPKLPSSTTKVIAAEEDGFEKAQTDPEKPIGQQTPESKEISDFAAEQVRVFPNPIASGNALHIQSPVGSRIVVQNIRGQIFMNETSIHDMVKFTPSTSGLYLINVYHTSKQKTVRVLVK
jgi:hypothetical protein